MSFNLPFTLPFRRSVRLFALIFTSLAFHVAFFATDVRIFESVAYGLAFGMALCFWYVNKQAEDDIALFEATKDKPLSSTAIETGQIKIGTIDGHMRTVNREQQL